ncbi:hypothetical protein BDD12DRAFT_780847 [Trichophaea hybrida]|nr:hypothetical protein BDD12DRAFT_780847 [Trichophaea hybrida]
MPLKRTRKLDVFNDSTEPPSARPSPRNAKRKRIDSGDQPSASQPKRHALEDKTRAANSRDTSFRDIKQESIDDKPLKQEKKGSASGTESLHTSCTITISPVQDVLKPSTGIFKQLESHSSDIHHIQSLVTEEKFQEAADVITQKGLWTPELLAEFGTTDLTTLDLSSSPTPGGFSIPTVPSSLLLAPLFTQHRYTKLSTIILRNTIVSPDDIALLRVLPSLSILDLCSTGINNHALYYLVCHSHTLTNLNISNNERITDDARPIFSALPNLTALYLRGTSFSLPALRRLVIENLPKGCRLLSLPSYAIDFLNNRHEKYCVEIPQGYITDPAKVENMALPVLKRNLELHAKFNKGVQLTGTKVDLVHRLRALLSNRIGDERIIGVLGRGSS